MGIWPFKKKQVDEDAGKWALDAEEIVEVVTEENAKVIMFSGTEICDLLYYTVKIGINEGKKVLVVDNSWKQDFYALCEREDNSNVEHVGKLTVCRGFKLTKQQMNVFDYVFVYSGHNVDSEQYYNPDAVIYNITAEAHEVKSLVDSYNNIMDRCNGTAEGSNGTKIPAPVMILVFRDLVNRKVSVNTLMRNNKLNIKNVVEIPLYSEDKSAYINLTYNKEAKLKGLSPELTESIKAIAGMLYETNDKKLAKYFKS